MEKSQDRWADKVVLSFRYVVAQNRINANLSEWIATSVVVLFNYFILELRVAHLNLSITLHTSAAPLQKKYMHVQLTDNSDSFFLCTLRIDEDDFQSLKVNQGLLVDFPSFPQKLTELLNLCLNEEKREIPKFIVQLIMSDGHSTLNIVETNPFKHLIHLSLKVLPGNNEAIKTYLSECLRDYKDKNEKLTNELQSTGSSLRSSLKATEEALAARNAELTSMKMQWESKLSELQAKHAHGVNAEKEQSMKSQTATQQRFQQEKRDLEQAHMKIVKQLEARLYEVDTQNKELTEARFVNDASIRDLTAKFSAAEDDGKKMRLDVQQLRKDNSELESELHRQEKSTNQLTTRVAVLEQQVKDKDTVITNSTDLLHAEQAQKKLIEDELALCKSRISQLESNIKTLSDEIIKANEIIRKLQQDNKNIHAKLKLRSQIALKQEEVLKDKENQVAKQEVEVKNLREQASKDAKILSEMKSKLASLESEQEEYQKKIASNENVISWLNKQLDQVQMGRARIGASLTSSSVPTHIVSISQSNNSHGHSKVRAPDQIGEATPNQLSRIPQPKYKSTPITDALDEDVGKENEPAIDAKYLPQNVGPAPAPLKTRNWMSNPADSVLPPVKTRISKDLINPHKALATAYFPKQK